MATVLSLVKSPCLFGVSVMVQVQGSVVADGELNFRSFKHLGQPRLMNLNPDISDI